MLVEDLYQEVLLEEAEHPQNKGTLPNAQVVLPLRNASCGDIVTVYLSVNSDGKVFEIAWEGDGCVISQAAMSVVSEAVKGKNSAEVSALGLPDVLDLLHFDTISPGRIKCSMLGLTALQKAVGKIVGVRKDE